MKCHHQMNAFVSILCFCWNEGKRNKRNENASWKRYFAFQILVQMVLLYILIVSRITSAKFSFCGLHVKLNGETKVSKETKKKKIVEKVNKNWEEKWRKNSSVNKTLPKWKLRLFNVFILQFFFVHYKLSLYHVKQMKRNC